MKVLIVESNPGLAALWSRHLARQGVEILTAYTQYDAVEALRRDEFNVIVLDLVIEGGSAIAIADFAAYRRPDAKVIFVTASSFFSDGSIFRHIPNACAHIGADSNPDDLAAIVDFYGRPGTGTRPVLPN